MNCFVLSYVFYMYINFFCYIQQFEANFDQNTQVYHALPAGIVARKLRVRVQSSYGTAALRWQLHGCYSKGNLLVFRPLLIYDSCCVCLSEHKKY